MTNLAFVLVLGISFSAVNCFILSADTNRKVTAVLRVANGGQYGYWTRPHFCPNGTFASGYSMKIEPQQTFGDDTSLNGIRLTCSDETGHSTNNVFDPNPGTISSEEGPFGSYGKVETCKQWFNNTDYLTRFALQVEAPQGGGDDTAANFVKFECQPITGVDSQVNVTELVASPGAGYWGKWGEWSEPCPVNSAICGLMTKIETVQGDGDDTALNDVVFYCCSKDGRGNNGNGGGIVG
ncbi:Vitelline membrane outer layer protein 1 [Mactra antiquata]